MAQINITSFRTVDGRACTFDLVYNAANGRAQSLTCNNGTDRSFAGQYTDPATGVLTPQPPAIFPPNQQTVIPLSGQQVVVGTDADGLPTVTMGGIEPQVSVWMV